MDLLRYGRTYEPLFAYTESKPGSDWTKAVSYTHLAAKLYFVNGKLCIKNVVMKRLIIKLFLSLCLWAVLPVCAQDAVQHILPLCALAILRA